MREKLRGREFCVITAAVLAIALCAFIYILADSAIFPLRIVFFVAAALFILSAASVYLAYNINKRRRCIVSAVLSVILIIVQAFGCYYVLVGRNTLEKITDPDAEYSEIGIFVRADDPAEMLADIKDYAFGVLDVQDRESTDKALEEISNELKTELEVAEYSGVEALMNALLRDREIGVIVINKSFLDLLEDVDGHENDAELIREIHTVLDEVEGEAEQAPIIEDNIFSVYISGIDCYGRLSRKSRSDVNILATVNVETGQVLLVSTPRDYFIPLSISGGIPDKLTHAGIYGIDVSRDTLAMLYGTEIDYYFRVNFDGFKEIIDALGGVNVYSEYTFSSGKHRFVKGDNFLNGNEALAFARSRYALAGGDRQRGKNQMAVIKGVIDKATGPAIIMNYKSTLDSLAGAFETNMSYETITGLIQNQINKGTKWNVVSYSVDGTGASRKPYSLSTKAYVMIPNQTTVDKAKALIAQVENGEVPTP